MLITPLLLSAAAPVAGHVIVVGRDYPTLAAAVAAVPLLRAGLGPGEALELVLPPGPSRITKPVVIGPDTGGSVDHPLVIRGADDGSSYLTGAQRVSARPPRTGDAPGFALPAGTMVLDLRGLGRPAGLDRRGPHVTTMPSSTQLFQGDRPLTPSRWPATGDTMAAATGANATGPVVALPPTLTARWRQEPALWAAGYWGADWEYERAPVAGVAGAGLRLAPLGAQQPVRARVRFHVENAVSELSSGHAVLLPTRGIALVVPFAGTDGFEATRAPTLLQLNGSAHVVVFDLGFERSVGDAIRIEGASDVVIAYAQVRDVGGNGIMVSGGRNVAIRGTIVSRIGERGVVLGGGDRPTLTPAGHSFTDGLITDWGQLSPSYRPAVDMWGVGNRVSGSVIAGGDHAAIVVNGNDHRIVDNEIRDVLRDADDAGAVYMGADWTQRGNIVSGNFIHRLGVSTRSTQFVIGVYLDDQIGGTQVTGNVIVGGDYGVAIGGGRDNVVSGNILAPTRGGVYVDTRGLDNQRGALAAFVGKLRAMPTSSPVWRRRYPTLATLQSSRYSEPAGNAVRDNLLAAPGASLLAGTPAAQRWVATSGNSAGTLLPSSREQDRAIAALAGKRGMGEVVRNRVPALETKLSAGLHCCPAVVAGAARHDEKLSAERRCG